MVIPVVMLTVIVASLSGMILNLQRRVEDLERAVFDGGRVD